MEWASKITGKVRKKLDAWLDARAKSNAYAMSCDSAARLLVRIQDEGWVPMEFKDKELLCFTHPSDPLLMVTKVGWCQSFFVRAKDMEV